MDTYSQQKGYSVPGVVTGKPIQLGGSEGRGEATGRGVIICAQEACRETGLPFPGSRIVVQGFGNVGRNAAEIADERGANVVAISDVGGGVYNPDGLDLEALAAWSEDHGGLHGFPEGEAVSNQEILELPCEILIPAAIQNQITEHNAASLDCKLVVEGANGPTTLEADAILSDRGIVVVPDILANAGGVTVSYFEWVQGLMQFFWSEEEVNEKLQRLMVKAFLAVHHMAKEQNVSLRSAALMLGIERVKEAKRTRGVFP
jgi:glutamate dehydrogenase (NAD(P)+)